MPYPAQDASAGAVCHDRPLIGLIDLVPDLLFVTDHDSRITDVNAVCENRFGKPRQEVIGRGMFEFLESVCFKPDVVSRLKQMSEKILKSGQPFCFEDEADGTWSRYVIDSIHGSEGSVARLFYIIQDITQRKRNELNAQKELELKTLLLDSMPASAIILDATGRIMRWNRYARDIIFGKKDDEMRGIDPLGIVHPDDRSMLMDKLLNVLNYNVVDSVEARLRIHGSSDYIWGFTYGRRVVIDGEICVLIVGMNIDDRKKLEEEQRQSQARWDSILQKWHIGLWELDLQKNTIESTREHNRIFGYESFRPMWSLQTLLDHLIPDERAGFRRFYRENMSNLSEWHREFQFRRSDGELRWASAVGAFKFDGKGQPTHVQGVVQDITDRKQIELSNRHFQEQLQQSQKMELLGQLAGGIAHDFNNVLTAIIGNTEVLLNKFDDSHPAYENLEIISKSARRSADMVRQLLGFARKQMVRPKVIDLEAELKNLRAMLRQMISVNVQLQLNFKNRHTMVRIDPSQLAQIVTNLVLNARDAIIESGTITITTDSLLVSKGDCDFGYPRMNSGKYVRLSVSDTGRGIPENNLAHIFEPYFTTKEIGKGTGLGLSTVYGIVKQNNGYVKCRSEESKGSEFSIYLPECTGDPVEEDVAEPLQSERKNSETIMLVEDDPDILKFLREVLESNGFSVLSAGDAESAASRAEICGEEIALLITDIILPNMNGIQLGNKLIGTITDLRILYMSGYAADIFDHQEISPERVNFISKPFSIDDFMAKVYLMLKQP
jgi:PAS domain S-box-containing protein